MSDFWRTGTEVVEVGMASIPAVALQMGVTRQAVWNAVQEGRVNSICREGDILIYLDSRLEAWRGRARRGPRPRAKRT